MQEVIVMAFYYEVFVYVGWDLKTEFDYTFFEEAKAFGADITVLFLLSNDFEDVKRKFGHEVEFTAYIAPNSDTWLDIVSTIESFVTPFGRPYFFCSCWRYEFLTRKLVQRFDRDDYPPFGSAA
jgi:hypothetical protein